MMRFKLPSPFYNSFEEHLASNWPRVWLTQGHVALMAIVVGTMISLCVLLITYLLGGKNESIWLSIPFLIQAILCMAWYYKLQTVPVVENLLRYRNSPKVSTLLLISIVIISVPFLVNPSGLKNLLWREFVFGYMIFLQAVAIIIFSRLRGIFGPSNMVPGTAAGKLLLCTVTISVLILLSILGSTWAGGEVPFYLALAAWLVVMIYYVGQAFYRRSRTLYASAFVIVMYIMPAFVGMFISLSLVLDGTKSNAVAGTELLVEGSQSLIESMVIILNQSVAISILTLLLSIVWCDIFSFLVARFFMLPERRR
jgi:hypothetical protein